MTKIGKLWTGAVAYVSLLTGAGLSVAGNLADTYRTRGADVDTLDKVMAAAWPILVLLAIEMFVSPRWSPDRLFQTWRWIGCLGVGGMAMIVSWTHLHDLLSARSQLPVVAVLGPLAIDGMAIMATGLILSTRVRGHADTDTPIMSAPLSVSDVLEAKDQATMDKWMSETAAVISEVAVDIGKLQAQAQDMSGHAADGYRDLSAEEVSAYLDRLADTAKGRAVMDTVLSADTDRLSGYERWADLRTPDGVDTDTPVHSLDMARMMSWAEETRRADSADTAESLATEASAYLSAMSMSAPAADTLPQRTRTSGASYPQEFADMVTAWSPDQLPRADLVKLSAAYYGVSTRTASRWLSALTGQPVSGPPEGGEGDG